MRSQFSPSSPSASALVPLVLLSSGTTIAWSAGADVDAPLPANAGRNFALNRAAVASDPNTGWDKGLTDGSWEGNSLHAFATGAHDSFPKTVTIDLEKNYRLSLVRLGVPSLGSTKTIKVALGTDGQTFTDVGSYQFSQSKAEAHLYAFEATAARYVRLTYPDHYAETVAFAPNYVFTTEVEAYAPTDVAAQTEPIRPPAVTTSAPAPVVAQPADSAAAKLAVDGNIDPVFVQQHEKFLKRGKEGPIGLLFVGDSITAGWAGAKDLWQAHYGQHNPANFGIGGDRTQHVLWRIANGELDGISPKAVVLLLGTNNLGSGALPEEVLKGDVKVISEIHRKLPDAKLLVLGIFPRGADIKTPWINLVRVRTKTVNAELAKLDDGNKTRFLDFGDKLLNAEGNPPVDIMPDFLHPNIKGYQIWADAMQPLLDEMLH